MGPSVRRVLIEDVDFEKQLVTVLMPAIQTRLKIPLMVRRVRCETPKVGETWFIERTLGSQWALGALVAETQGPPVVTGDRPSGAVLSILEALVQLGLVVDETTMPG